MQKTTGKEQGTSNVRLLIVDDELEFYQVFCRSHRAHYDFETSSDADRGLDLIKTEKFDAVLLDLSFKGHYTYDEGLDYLLPKAVNLAKGAFPILVASFDNRKESQQRASKNGAFLFLRKDDYGAAKWDDEIRKAIRDFKAVGQATSKSNAKAGNPAQPDGFLVLAPPMQDIKKRLAKLAEYPEYSVLLLGESGTGKEVAAETLHRAKNNPKLPFIAVNLSALNEKLVESELFGHIKGSFTGADADKEGYFQKAKGGTLFLDEIGEISLELQYKLLRVLQQKEFSKVGSTALIPLDAQLVFATNRNLEQAVAEKQFRYDFYERIKPHAIYLPPLRERMEELLPLFDYFWTKSCTRPSNPLYGQKASTCCTSNCLRRLQEYAWPGNVRELKSTVEELIFEVDFQERTNIEEDLLPRRFRMPAPVLSLSSPLATQDALAFPQADWRLSKQTAFLELMQIEQVLIRGGGRKDEVARALGLKNDQALRYKIKKKYHNIFPDLFVHFPVISKLYKF